ncbi:MAG TPA: HTTM domain-containing protein [Candidatus Dormibacteraeota bacterium]|nr:HTTM domain-containing protein [Candidatus Dormibacteraeota bacterium]
MSKSHTLKEQGATTLLRRWSDNFMGFLFPLETDKWLGALRIGLGLQVAGYALFLKSDWHYLFASTGRGLVSRKLGEAITSFDSPLIPKLGWLVTLGGYAHIGEDAVLSIVWTCLLCMGLLLLLGLFSRPAAIIAWFLHLCAAESGGLFAYGADNFMTTGLFYLMLSPLPDRYSLDHWLLKGELRGPQLLGFWRRVLQVHMCFVYFIGGLAKCLGSGWWDGSNLWRSLTRPPFNLISPDILVRFKYALPILGISICLIELGYPFFIWIRKTRLFWLVCILVMHAAIGLAMGMYLFALVMIVLNFAAFGIGMSSERPVSAEVTVARSTVQRTGTSRRSALGAPPLRG